jgi:hypothetical protein
VIVNKRSNERRVFFIMFVLLGKYENEEGETHQ